MAAGIDRHSADFEISRCVDTDNARRVARLDGKFVVHSNDDSLTPEDIALGYKQLMQVEQAWRMLKSGIKIRPCCRGEVDETCSRRRGAGRPPLQAPHWAPHRICAHVSLTMISLLLERIAENACGDTWRNIRADLRQLKLIQFLTPDGPLWQRTEPSPAALNRLKQLGLQLPPQVLQLG